MAEEINPKNKKQNPAKEKGFKIKTMRRDLARLRLLESENERRKIISLIPHAKKDDKEQEREKEKEIKEKAEKRIIRMTDTEPSPASVPEPVAAPATILPKSKIEITVKPTQQASPPPLTPHVEKIESEKRIQEIREEKIEAVKKRIQMLKSETQKKEKAQEKKSEDESPERLKIKQWAEKQRKQYTSELKEELEKPVQVTDRLPKRPSLEKKQWVRFLIPVAALIMLLGTIFFLYWFLVKREKPTPEPLPELPEISEPERETEPDSEPHRAVPPSSLIPTVNEKILSVSEWEELPDAISQYFSEQTEQGLTHVLAKNINDEYLQLDDFLNAFEVNLPTGFLEKLEQDVTPFVYTYSNNEKRFGFAIKIREGKVIGQEMIDWEENMESDIRRLLTIPDEEYINTPHTNIFKPAQYQGVSFRLLTISLSDFGICYIVQNNRLIFTTSFEQMKSVITAIQQQKEITNTIKTKIGQLFMVGFEGKTVTADVENFFREYKPGAVLLLSKNIENESQVKELTSNLQELSLRETGYPLLIAVDQEGGLVSRVNFLSEKTPQSEIQSAEDAYTIGMARGQQLKSLGINMNLAPLLDLTIEQDFIFERTFQKDASQTGLFAKFLVSGQKDGGVLSAVKHFPGYREINFNPEDELAIKDAIPEISQFAIVSEASPEFVMTSNVVYKDIDSLFPFVFTQKGINLIKETMGDSPLIITDDLGQYSLLDNYSLEQIATKPLNAGTDMMILSGWRQEPKYIIEALLSSYQKGLVSEEIINKAYQRIINIKQGL